MIQYGLLGAGAVNLSFIARLPRKAEELGPVCALSYRVASRIANSLRAGTASKDVSDLNRVHVILLCSNPLSLQRLLLLLAAAKIDWMGKRILLCDTACEALFQTGIGKPAFPEFRERGASLASICQMELPGRYLLQGDADATKHARAMVRELEGRAIQLPPNRAALFQAGMTIGTALLTPLLDRVAECFRSAGLRDKQALELASILFERTARKFGHSGRQSWEWHIRSPDLGELEAEIAALEQFTEFGPDFVRDLLSGLQRMGRHREIAKQLKKMPRS